MCEVCRAMEKEQGYQGHKVGRVSEELRLEFDALRKAGFNNDLDLEQVEIDAKRAIVNEGVDLDAANEKYQAAVSIHKANVKEMDKRHKDLFKRMELELGLTGEDRKEIDVETGVVTVHTPPDDLESIKINGWLAH